MRIRQLRTVGCATAVLLAFGVLGFTPMLANAKDPDVVFTADSYPGLDSVQSAQSLALEYLRDFTGESASMSDVVVHTENDAYSHLIQGNADAILATAPTAAEVASAAQAGIELQTIPVAQSRLVILADANNPVETLTVNQLRDIYSGVITDWAQVGGDPGPITAYQRGDGSGSQTGMLDLVMKGTEMMDPPTGIARWMGTVAQTVTNFVPTPGALGYAYSYYVSAIWPDLVSNGTADGVKVVKVNGISPDPSVQNYPLTTTYDLVMKASEPKNSPVRVLADQVASPHGQALAAAAGYIPVGPTDLPDSTPSPTLATSPTPEASPSVASTDLPAQASDTVHTYAVNPVTISTRVGYVRASSDEMNYCALVERAVVEGLANQGLQTSLMTDFVSRQDDFLMHMWGVDQLIAAPSCTDNAVPDVVLRTFATADFSNVLSLVSSWGIPGSPEAHDPAATMNVRLDNGQELMFADLFTASTNIADLIQAEALSSDPQATEQDILSWVDDYNRNPDREFSFSATSATLYIPGVANGEDTGVTVGYASRRDDVEVFTLASGATGLYASTAESTPVATIEPPKHDDTDVSEPVVVPEDSVLTITSPPVTVLTDPCTGQTTTTPDMFTAEVDVVDGGGKPIPEAVVAFSATDGMMLTQQYVTADDHGVATVMAIMDQTALLRGAVPTVSASILRDGQRVPVAGSGVEVPVTISAPPVPTTQPVATISDSTVPADNASSYTVSVEWKDGCGVPVVGQSVSFSVDGSAIASSSSVVLDQDGRAEILVRDPVAEAVMLQTEVPSSVGESAEVQGLRQLVFVPAVVDPHQSSISAVDAFVTIPCGSPGSTTLSAMVKDRDGHPLYLKDVEFFVNGNAQLSDSAPTTDMSGIATITLSDDVAETVTVTASLESGEEITGSPVTVSFVPGCAPPPSTSMWFSVSEGPKVADGLDAYAVTIYAKDVNGGPVKGLAGDFEIRGEDESVQVDEITEGSDGTYTAHITSTQAGIFAVHVSLNQDDQTRELANSPSVVVFVSPWQPSLTVNVAASGGQSSVITAQISVRMGTSAPAPLVGQASLLSAAAQDSDSVRVGDFREERPGVYTATATTSVPGDYQIVVSWKENGTGVITADKRISTR